MLKTYLTVIQLRGTQKQERAVGLLAEASVNALSQHSSASALLISWDPTNPIRTKFAGFAMQARNISALKRQLS